MILSGCTTTGLSRVSIRINIVAAASDKVCRTFTAAVIVAIRNNSLINNNINAKYRLSMDFRKL